MDNARIYEAKRAYAEKKGFSLNPDKKTVVKIIDGLIANFERFGSFYCPCRIITGNKDVDKDNICPCKYLEQELKDSGECHCKLFVKKR